MKITGAGMKNKPTIHIGKAAYGDGPPRMGARVLCGKPAGSTTGVMSLTNFMAPFCDHTHPEAYYNIHYTRKGIKHAYKDRREAAAKSCKMYGYYCQYLDGWEFTVCKECLGSADFALLALANI